VTNVEVHSGRFSAGPTVALTWISSQAITA
jgi:hypothetical protein